MMDRQSNSPRSLRTFFLLFVLMFIFQCGFAQGFFQWANHYDSQPRRDSSVSSVQLDNAGNVYTLSEHNYLRKHDPQGNQLWSIQFQWGLWFLTERSMYIDDQGNLFLTGGFITGGPYNFPPIDFDPGPGTVLLTASGTFSSWSVGLGTTWGSEGNFDTFVLKLDTAGNFQWVKQFPGDGMNWGKAIVEDDDGNLYVSGIFNDSTDFDPGPGVAGVRTAGQGDAYLVKLDSSGNFLWANTWGSSTWEGVSGMCLDSSGNVYTSGFFQQIIDFDPGPGVVNMNAISGSAFILKWDPTGNLVWAKQSGGTIHAMDISSNGELYIAGGYMDSLADFDPGPGVFRLGYSGVNPFFSEAFVTKLDINGNFFWAKAVAEGTPGVVNAITLDRFGKLYLTGTFSGTGDFDPGPGTYPVTGSPAINWYGTGDLFVSKLTPNGELEWATGFNPMNGARGDAICTDDSLSIYIWGEFHSRNDFDPGPDSLIFVADHFLGNRFLVKLGQDTCASFSMFIDSVKDVSCSVPGTALGRALGSHPPHQFVWNTNPIINDSIGTFNQPGIYRLTVADSIGCVKYREVLISGPGAGNTFDLKVNMVGPSIRPGFPFRIGLDAFNANCPQATGELTFRIPNGATFVSASPVPDSVFGDTLRWNFNAINYDSIPLQPQIDLLADTSLTIGDKLCFYAEITPFSGDADSLNNRTNFCPEIVNSYDPNDKRVYPEGECEPGYISPNQKLTYTVRFQNTGNAEAINIYILDSLDPHLDLQSVRVIGKSHSPMITEILPGNVLKFRFDNIHLPDSATNEPASNGYVIFEVDPLPGLVNGTEINNEVGIYFDFNAPVITNTVLNTITHSLPGPTYHTLTETVCDYFIGPSGAIYTTTGHYTDIIPNSAGCDSVTTIDLTVIELNVTVARNGNMLSALATMGQFQWVDCEENYTPIAGAQGRFFEPEEPGEYALVVNQFGCTDTSDCFSMLGVGIASLPKVRLYPNPTTGSIRVDLGHIHPEVNIVVTDLAGKPVFSEKWLQAQRGDDSPHWT